jgi:DNA-binding response OmpR family regulator
MAHGVSVSVTTPSPAPPPSVAMPDAAPAARIAILEDDPRLGELAVELCRDMNVEAAHYFVPADFLDAARRDPPRALILDWRLNAQLGAAAFMAVRHRYPDMPVVCWTASPAWQLPQMIRQDAMSRVVDKAAGAADFEAAVRWAIG